MTILQKIQNLTWWTLDIKLKDILSNLLNRVEIIEESESGGSGLVSSVNTKTGAVVLNASDIANIPLGSISSTNTQDAINELDNGKLNTANPSFTGAMQGSIYLVPLNGYYGTSDIKTIDYDTSSGFLQNTASGWASSLPFIYQADSIGLNGKAYSVRLGNVEKYLVDVEGNVTANSIKSNGVVRLKNYTVATLPTGVQGDTAYVTDLLTPTYMATAVGGGAVVWKVFHDGTSWKVD